MQNELDRRSARATFRRRHKKKRTYLHERRWPRRGSLSGSLSIVHWRLSSELAIDSSFFRTETVREKKRARTHLKHASHAKVKYGMPPFAIEFEVENFACVKA